MLLLACFTSQFCTLCSQLSVSLTPFSSLACLLVAIALDMQIWVWSLEISPECFFSFLFFSFLFFCFRLLAPCKAAVIEQVSFIMNPLYPHKLLPNPLYPHKLFYTLILLALSPSHKKTKISVHSAHLSKSPQLRTSPYQSVSFLG